MRTYRLTFGVEGLEPIEGTEEEVCEILDTYPEAMVLELYSAERRAGSPTAHMLLRYLSRRYVDEFESGRLSLGGDSDFGEE